MYPHLPERYPADADTLMLHDPLPQRGLGRPGGRTQGLRVSRLPGALRLARPGQGGGGEVPQTRHRTGQEGRQFQGLHRGPQHRGLAARYYIQNFSNRTRAGTWPSWPWSARPTRGRLTPITPGPVGTRSGRQPQRHRLWAFLNLYWNSIEGLYEDAYDLGDLDSDDYGTTYAFLHSAQSGSDRVGAELHDLLPTFDFLYYKDSGDWGLTSTDNRNTILLDLNADANRSERMTKDGAGDTVRAAVFYSVSRDTIHRHETSNPDYFFLQEPRYADGNPSPG